MISPMISDINSKSMQISNFVKADSAVIVWLFLQFQQMTHPISPVSGPSVHIYNMCTRCLSHFFWQFAETCCDVTNYMQISNSYCKSNIQYKLLWNRVKQLAQRSRTESLQTGISKDRQNHEMARKPQAYLRRG